MKARLLFTVHCSLSLSSVTDLIPLVLNSYLLHHFLFSASWISHAVIHFTLNLTVTNHSYNETLVLPLIRSGAPAL